MSQTPEQLPDPQEPQVNEPVLDALEAVHAAKRIIEEETSKESEVDLRSAVPEDVQRKLSANEEERAAEWDRLDAQGIHSGKQIETELAKKGLTPPPKPEEVEQQALVGDAEAREAREGKSQKQPKPANRQGNAINRPSNRPNVYDRDQNVKDFYDSSK
jgi:hypothetical protein